MSATPPEQHRAEAPARIRCAALTISDTRDLSNDKSGDLIAARLEGAGHELCYRDIVTDDPERIRAGIEACRSKARVALLTGGTGLTPRDSTFEVVSALIERPIPGFGELFRMLSYEEIGAAAMLSRACAGVSGELLIFALPGSSGGVRTALDKLILPELGHLLQQLDRAG